MKKANRALLVAMAIIAIAAAMVAADIPNRAYAQSEDGNAGRIVARLLDDGRVEFGWQPTGGERVLPRQRYFPASGATVDRWLRSSPVEVNGVEIGRINARLLDNGRIEFGFTPTDGERILTRARYFPTDAQVGRWLRSTEITISTAPSPFIAISSDAHTCGLRKSGAIECWGLNEHGQTNAPAGRFTAVNAGNLYTCAIRESGEIECWGRNDYGQTDAPEGRFTAVSGGSNHACGLRENGAIECWGHNGFQQTNAPEGIFIAVGAGAFHTCGLRESDEIVCWGGQNGHGELSNTPEGRFTAVSAGLAYTCAIRESGEIECWGRNERTGSFNQETQTFESVYAGQIDAPEGNFTAVSAGAEHTCGVRENGAIECWGSNAQEQTNAPEGVFIAVSAGSWHTCGLRDDGTIECWGGNYYGETDAPAP